MNQIGFTPYGMQSDMNQFCFTSDCRAFCVKQIGFDPYIMQSDKKHNLPYSYFQIKDQPTDGGRP